MLKLKTEQQKTLYLRGFVGSVYEDGVWEEPADAVYGGENAGMLGWLEENAAERPALPVQGNLLALTGRREVRHG